MLTRISFWCGAALLTLALAVPPVQADPPSGEQPAGDRGERGDRGGDQREPREGNRSDRPDRRGPRMDVEAMSKRLMQRFDKDGDNKLDASELVGVLEQMRSRGGPRPDGDRPRGDRPRGGRGPGDAGEMFKRFFSQHDKNDDGKLSDEEIPERMRRNLDRIDTNSDGAIDKSEAETMFKRMRDGQPRGDRPRGDRPRGDRPREEGDRPRGDQPREEGDRPQRPAAE